MGSEPYTTAVVCAVKTPLPHSSAVSPACSAQGLGSGSGVAYAQETKKEGGGADGVGACAVCAMCAPAGDEELPRQVARTGLKPLAQSALLRPGPTTEGTGRPEKRPHPILSPAGHGGAHNIRELCLFLDRMPAAWQQLQSVGVDDHRELDDVVTRFVSVLRSITELLMKSEETN